jgi:GNAT superfamily N-acetyltransferase
MVARDNYPGPVADVSVRAADADDAAEIARIQLDTWRTAYEPILPAESLAALDEAAVRETWRAAVVEPPSPHHHVLVAQEQEWLVGFAAIGPTDEILEGDPEPDTTAAVTTLLVEPRWGRRGHGSRLLAASVDHWREDGLTRAVVWLPEDDAASSAFYASAGWARDGYVRALDTGAGTLREVRWHVSLADGEHK